jgi:hypothetical protein
MFTWALPRHHTLILRDIEGGGISFDASKPRSNTTNPDDIYAIWEMKKRENSINIAKAWFIDARADLIEKSKEFTQVANERVESLLREHPYFQKLPIDQARDTAHKMVNSYIMTHADDYKANKLRLQNEIPPVAQQEIQKRLDEEDQEAFAKFVKEEVKKLQVNERVKQYLDLIPEPDRESYTHLVQAFFSERHFDSKASKARILDTMVDTGGNIDKTMVNEIVWIEMDREFLIYAQAKGIPIDYEKLKNRETEIGTKIPIIDDVDGEKVINIVSSGKNLMTAHDEFTTWADEMRSQKDIYTEKVEEYHHVRNLEIKTGDDTIETSWSPEALQSLKSGESLYFVHPGESSDALYRAEREPDWEYTLTFRGMTFNNLPKKEIDVIIDLNSIPVISSIFSINSTLYRTLLREYRVLCMMWGTDPLENPPLWFIDFLYSRLNDAYLSSNPKDENTSLIGSDISGLWYKARGKYIRDVLHMNIGTRNEAMKRLEDQKIIIAWKVNLAKFPR